MRNASQQHTYYPNQYFNFSLNRRKQRIHQPVSPILNRSTHNNKKSILKTHSGTNVKNMNVKNIHIHINVDSNIGWDIAEKNIAELKFGNVGFSYAKPEEEQEYQDVILNSWDLVHKNVKEWKFGNIGFAHAKFEKKMNGTPWTYTPRTVFLKHHVARTTTYPGGTTMAICENNTLLTQDPLNIVTSTNPDGTTFTNGLPDGTRVVTYPNGVITKFYQDGSNEIYDPNDDTKTITYQLGIVIKKYLLEQNIEITMPDKTIITIKCDNTVIISGTDATISYYFNGKVELKVNKIITRFYPEGFIEIIENGIVSKHDSNQDVFPVYPYQLVQFFRNF
uniref:Uncharacterized protein n=1 Tax=viral metagenome TaxID=1070528 RepID=A0A6C0E6P3_9ZZZZ